MCLPSKRIALLLFTGICAGFGVLLGRWRHSHPSLVNRIAMLERAP